VHDTKSQAAQVIHGAVTLKTTEVEEVLGPGLITEEAEIQAERHGEAGGGKRRNERVAPGPEGLDERIVGEAEQQDVLAGSEPEHVSGRPGGEARIDRVGPPREDPAQPDRVRRPAQLEIELAGVPMDLRDERRQPRRELDPVEVLHEVVEPNVPSTSASHGSMSMRLPQRIGHWVHFDPPPDRAQPQ
jgi:hypothetical protein